MNMTHYMQLLADNQPWNLIAFMAVPVILAETVAITELYILFSRQYHGVVRSINRAASIVGGVYFSGVFVYLTVNAVIPLTTQGGWRGPADVIAVLAYLSGIVPLLGLGFARSRAGRTTSRTMRGTPEGPRHVCRGLSRRRARGDDLRHRADPTLLTSAQGGAMDMGAMQH